jgi:hypothetical protein
MKHSTLASRRFAQAKAELRGLLLLMENQREDEGAAQFFNDLKFIRLHADRGFFTRLDEAILSAGWAANQEKDGR